LDSKLLHEIGVIVRFVNWYNLTDEVAVNRSAGDDDESGNFWKQGLIELS